MNGVKKPIVDTELEYQIWYEGTNREIRGLPLSDVGGEAKIGFGILELSPGCNTLPPHYHTLEDEHLYVLEGKGTLHLGDNSYPLARGSYVNFPAGQKAHHYLSNNTEDVLKYIIVGERIKEDHVYYRRK